MKPTQLITALIFCFALASSVNGSSDEQVDLTQSENETLRVATIQRAPFAFRRGDVWSGYSIDLLRQLEATLGKQATVVEASSIDELLRMVEEGQVDWAIGNISVTAEREERIDFSHAIYASGLQIAVSDGQTIAGLFPIAMFSTRLMRIVAAAGIVLLFVAHGLWFFERGSERDFRDSYYGGIWDAFWWAAVTITTVGYGDQVPRSNCGRIVGLTWMFASLFLVTIFVAHTTNALSGRGHRSFVDGPGALTNKRVVSVIGSTAQAYLQRAGHKHIAYESPDAMFAAVAQGEADALVYDAPVVYHRSKATGNRIIPVGPVFNHEDIGIALPEESAFREPINRALLALKSEGVVEQIREHWFD